MIFRFAELFSLYSGAASSSENILIRYLFYMFLIFLKVVYILVIHHGEKFSQFPLTKMLVFTFLVFLFWIFVSTTSNFYFGEIYRFFRKLYSESLKSLIFPLYFCYIFFIHFTTISQRNWVRFLYFSKNSQWNKIHSEIRIWNYLMEHHFLIKINIHHILIQFFTTF